MNPEKIWLASNHMKLNYRDSQKAIDRARSRMSQPRRKNTRKISR